MADIVPVVRKLKYGLGYEGYRDWRVEMIGFLEYKGLSHIVNDETPHEETLEWQEENKRAMYCIWSKIDIAHHFELLQNCSTAKDMLDKLKKLYTPYYMLPWDTFP